MTRHGEVEILTLDRPDQHNALNAALCQRLTAAVTTGADRSRALVITGTGRSFCAGADFGEVGGAGFREALYAALQTITAVDVPVIAAVNGPAIGAGTQLAIACDLRVADERARFALPTARLGLAVNPWTVRRLALLAGGGPTRHVLIGDGTLDRDAALTAGLVDRLGTAQDAIEWAQQLAQLAPLTLAYNKRALQDLLEPGPFPAELMQRFDDVWASRDLAEGLAARGEKRPPRFEGH